MTETLANSLEAIASETASQQQGSESVSIVVPCYNESEIVPHLPGVLDSVRKSLQPNFQPVFLFVDDGSTDSTYELLQREIGQQSDVQIIRHEVNKGIAAAILTGIRHAQSEIVCSIDADCTYDPVQLAQMIPQLSNGIDVVTASPYHADGHVQNVPAWRVRVSMIASRLYRLFMRNKLSCYTCCFRVYRTSCLRNTTLNFNGFVGVTELLWKIDRNGGQIVEYPATLRVREYGQSKMSFVRVAITHLRLIGRVALSRLFFKTDASGV